MVGPERVKETGEALQPKEIERKFLVDPTYLPEDFEKNPHKSIRQGYMVIGSDGSEARLRDKSGTYTITVKSKGDLVRGEWETGLTKEQFDALWPTTEGKRVEKTRFEVPFGGVIMEVDVYEGHLSGLVTAEVEFDDVSLANHFHPPQWVDSDVTADSAFKNQSLAIHGWPHGGVIS